MNAATHFRYKSGTNYAEEQNTPSTTNKLLLHVYFYDTSVQDKIDHKIGNIICSYRKFQNR